ncbi:glycosyltransferase family 4 protein [Vibrio sp. JPW-9-11-11]|uniref:glycosyltransferase family 4 protein n=1 Tax=Vibrio sp. JPW-9-11-11 TaxID=1416532 RepID=UPI0015932255|nr:glycosyltransferase family 4 protein [Vibrio sp. JPW-9-11-11]
MSIPVILHLHGADLKQLRNSIPRFWRYIFDSCYRYSTANIVLSESMKEQFDFCDAFKTKVVPNFHGFDNRIEDVISHIESSDLSTIRICYFSNVMASKGIGCLLDALNDLDCDFELKVAGKIMDDGTMPFESFKHDFLSRVESDERITYLDGVYGDDKYRFLLDNHIMVLPTFYKTEAQPISIIEALSLGNIVITTKHNYLSDLIENDRNGQLVNVKSPEEISYAINGLSRDRRRLKSIMLRNARFYYNDYSLLSHVNRVEEVIFHGKRS